MLPSPPLVQTERATFTALGLWLQVIGFTVAILSDGGSCGRSDVQIEGYSICYSSGHDPCGEDGYPCFLSCRDHTGHTYHPGD
jgi:hypothetical protein